MQVSTAAVMWVHGVPGFVPRLFADATVGLFRAEGRVFDAMLDGWSAQMLARGLSTETIAGCEEHDHPTTAADREAQVPA